jgi:hypothetical protein
MKISESERLAICAVLGYGEAHGYGNLISHLQTAWAAKLVEYGFSEKAARRATGRDGNGYPFLMQRDLIERGEWDETGARYAAKKPVGRRGTTATKRRKPTARAK